MNEASRVRIESARRMAALHARNPNVVAVLVTGSAARGEADDASDVDMSVYYRQMPTEEEFQGVRREIGGSDYIMYFGSAEEGGWVESYYIDGIRHDFAHTSVEQWEKEMEEVLAEHKTDSPIQKAVSGILDGFALHGVGLIDGWKERASRYPGELGEAMVRAKLRFRPRWVIARYAADRDDLLFYYELMIEAINGVLGVMLGLNGIYHWGEYKRMDLFLGAMTIAPADLSGRIKSILRTAPAAALQELDALVMETFALVERHMPAVDTAEPKRKYLRPFGE